MTSRIQGLENLCVGRDYEIFQDEVLMANAKIGAQHYGISLDHCTPTFVLKSEIGFIALIIQGSRKIDFKKVEAVLGVKKVTMANKDEILELTGSPIGSVCLINSELRTLVDHGVQQLEYCYGGCGVEKYTLKIRAADLLELTNAEIGDFVKAELN